MVQFLDPEIAEILQFLDPEIMKMDKQISGSRNRRNGAISGSRNHRKGGKILYQFSMYLFQSQYEKKLVSHIPAMAKLRRMN